MSSRPVSLDINDTSRDQKYRHSLQPKTGTTPPASPLRHTKSQNFENRERKTKKSVPPPILEVETPDEDDSRSVQTVNGSVKIPIGDSNRSSKQSRTGSRRTSKASSKSGVVNAAFDGDAVSMERLSRSNSTANSVRSSTRDPSVGSLSVVREQYCCWSRFRPRERILCATIGVLSFIILILVIIITLVATQGDNSKAKNILRQIVQEMQK